MTAGDLQRLLLVGAFGGTSFLFMRILAPELGPLLTVDLRLLIGGGLVLAYCKIVRLRVEWTRFWREYLILAGLNAIAPLTLFSFAAVRLPASHLVILNAGTPLIAATMGALLLKEPLGARTLTGLLVGILGVALAARFGTQGPDAVASSLAIAACLAGAACFASAGVYVRRFAGPIKPLAVAGASQVVAGVVLLPAASLAPLPHRPGGLLVASLVASALLCGTFVQVMYFRLLTEVGPTKATTIAFLMPVFGMMWAWLLLKEHVSGTMLAGGTLILIGTALVLLRRRPSSARGSPELKRGGGTSAGESSDELARTTRQPS
jgi:drug/metabolite transporter (DMT)-like permease